MPNKNSSLYFQRAVLNVLSHFIQNADDECSEHYDPLVKAELAVDYDAWNDNELSSDEREALLELGKILSDFTMRFNWYRQSNE